MAEKLMSAAKTVAQPLTLSAIAEQVEALRGVFAPACQAVGVPTLKERSFKDGVRTLASMPASDLSDLRAKTALASELSALHLRGFETQICALLGSVDQDLKLMMKGQ